LKQAGVAAFAYFSGPAASFFQCRRPEHHNRKPMKIRVGLVDDHQLFIKSLALLVESLGSYEVTLEALNGRMLQEKVAQMAPERLPQLMLIDVNMPVMDGPDTAVWLRKEFPSMHLVALSMNDREQSVIAMIRAGCCAYLLKDTHPNDLEKALAEIAAQGYYNGDQRHLNYRRLLAAELEEAKYRLTPREQAFLQQVCSDRTYKQIAQEMGVTERTIDGYREALFEKFNVGSRVGLCMEAVRRGLVQL